VHAAKLLKCKLVAVMNLVVLKLPFTYLRLNKLYVE